MKYLIITLALVCSCAEEEGVPPQISNLSTNTTTLSRGQATTVSGNFEFSDADGDVDVMKASMTPPTGAKVTLGAVPITAAKGQESGTAAFQIQVIPTMTGDHVLEIKVEDEQELESNSLEITLIAEP